MKAYLITTGILFALLTATHVWRIIVEGTHLAREPVFLLTSVASAALALWAWRLLKRPAK